MSRHPKSGVSVKVFTERLRSGLDNRINNFIDHVEKAQQLNHPSYCEVQSLRAWMHLFKK